MNKQWKLIEKSKQKRYVHADNHIINAFRGEQTLIGRRTWIENGLPTMKWSFLGC